MSLDSRVSAPHSVMTAPALARLEMTVTSCASCPARLTNTPRAASSTSVRL